MDQCHLREILNGDSARLTHLLLVAALTPFSLIYGLIMRVRRILYRRRILTVNRLDSPVVSIGNITAGGTGKTPMTAFIARWYIERGKRVAILTRGYGGSRDGSPSIVSDGTTIFLAPEEAGDEPVLLARTVPGLMVVRGHDRYQAGLLAQERLRPDLFIIDDGFQHMRLHRDLNIVLIDARRPFGNGRILPAGLLREHPSALSDADVVIRTRVPKGDPGSGIDGKHLFNARHLLAGLRPLPAEDNQPILPFSVLPEGNCIAVAGIGDPTSFFTSLEERGVRPAECLVFPDHATYGSKEAEMIANALRNAGGRFVITTEKDAVKFGSVLKLVTAPVYSAVLEMQVDEWTRLAGHLSPFL